jgi:hypothetical protein
MPVRNSVLAKWWKARNCRFCITTNFLIIQTTLINQSNRTHPKKLATTSFPYPSKNRRYQFNFRCDCRNVLSPLARLRDPLNILKSHRNPFEAGVRKHSGVPLSIWSQNFPIALFKFSKPLQASIRSLSEKARISQNPNRDYCSENLCA